VRSPSLLASLEGLGLREPLRFAKKNHDAWMILGAARALGAQLIPEPIEYLLYSPVSIWALCNLSE
jgi:hypothetical protein